MSLTTVRCCCDTIQRRCCYWSHCNFFHQKDLELIGKGSLFFNYLISYNFFDYGIDGLVKRAKKWADSNGKIL